MNKLHLPTKLPSLISLGSFLILIILVLTTNPLSDSAVIGAFFVLLLVFFISTAKLAVLKGYMSQAVLKQAVSLGVIIIALLMFISAKSLGVLDIIILILISSGLVFYLQRRGSS